MKYRLKIEGMSCEHCVKNVTNVLAGLNGVSVVRVSLENNSAEFDSDREILESEVKAALEDSGYDLPGFEKI